MDKVTITLKKPIEAHGETLREMVVQPPTGADLWELDGLDMSKPSYQDMVRVVQVCQKIPLHSAKAMDGGDLLTVAKAIFDFLGSSALVGEHAALT